jgi:hypothetical protein
MSVTAGVPLDQYDVFGPLVSRGDVEAAVLAQLQSPVSGIVFYIAERERRAGLSPRTLPTPPSLMSYRGGIDFETFKRDETPLLIAVVQPTGEPERLDSTNYGQWFEVQVAAVIRDESEDEARGLADHYGIAVAACLSQNGGLGGLENVVRTRLVGFPRVEFVNPDVREVIRSVQTFRVEVDPVLAERYGPTKAQPGPPKDPYGPPGDYTEVEDVVTTITAEPLN